MIICEVRTVGDETTKYTDAAGKDIICRQEVISEDNLGKTMQVELTNQSDKAFTGIIHLKKMLQCGNPEFFMEDTIGWGLQTFNTFDGEYGYGRVGWMSERFCFCEGLLTERYPDGEPASTWFALMP